MEFRLLPVIDVMLEFYQKPLSTERFHEYLKLLQGNTKGELAFPIGGFNPMAKEHVLHKLEELKTLNAENLVSELLPALNTAVSGQSATTVFSIALNLSDDLKGGWTNRYTSDYDSKFKINALLKRGFCTPVFRAGETYAIDQVKQRILEYAYRSIYRLSHPAPVTLKDHVEQEVFVAANTNPSEKLNSVDFESTDALYRQYAHDENYHLIFNFLYGSKAASSLEFPVIFEAVDFAGFRYAASFAEKTHN